MSEISARASRRAFCFGSCTMNGLTGRNGPVFLGPGAGGCPRGAGTEEDGAVAPGQSVHGTGSEAEGAAAGAGADLGHAGLSSGEAGAGNAGRHPAAALQGRDREELARIHGAGGQGAGGEHALLGGSAERDSGRGPEGLLEVHHRGIERPFRGIRSPAHRAQELSLTSQERQPGSASWSTSWRGPSSGPTRIAPAKRWTKSRR